MDIFNFTVEQKYLPKFLEILDVIRGLGEGYVPDSISPNPFREVTLSPI